MRFKLGLLLSSIFFILGFLTLPHYGINWDTINHLPRGQAYLHYFLTGNKDYSDLPIFFQGWQEKGQLYWQNPRSIGIDSDLPQNRIPARSIYQNDGFNYQYFINHDGDGHPPLSDILSSVFNEVLFRDLKLVNDIDSYHVYGIVLASALIFLIFYWVSGNFGYFSGLISTLILATYPLFWSESHFNTEKDVPETVFWSFILFSFWKAFYTKKIKWIISAGIFLGLALGTKFNVLFIPFVIAPWAIYVLYLENYFKSPIRNFVKNKLFVCSFILIPIIGLLIFFGHWPYLWSDPLEKVKSVIGFYKQIGTTEAIDPRYINRFGISKYPLIWIITTTPLVTLFYFLLGGLSFFSKLDKKQKSLFVLAIFWVLVPIIRVIMPHASIYGGIRQIMEFIPAMSILGGVGAYVLLQKVRIRGYVVEILMVLAFAPIILKLIQIHPYENVYFNPLIGGLSGAVKTRLPYAGNTFGSAYRQGVEWLNDHAENGANIVFAYELIPNFPRIWLRQDLNLYNSNRSGYLRKGEYAMTLQYVGMQNRSYYDNYLEEFLKPVYQIKVDEVSLLTIWKNDDQHLKRNIEEQQILDVKVNNTETGLKIDLEKEVNLSRLEINYNNKSCAPLAWGYVQLSKDNENWERLPGVLPDDWRISYLGEQPKDGHFTEPFVGQKARYINLVVSPRDTCLTNIKAVQAFSFK